MNISCKIADDLLPLYVDGSCSEDSRAALEEHLKQCPSCRGKLKRMQSGIPEDFPAEQYAPKLASYAKKVRKHQIRVAVSAVFIVVIAAAVLALVYLTIHDMYRQASPRVHEVEAGTYNLTAGELETTAEAVGQYVFFTNYTQIKVTVQGDSRFQGTVLLWNAGNRDSFIQIHDVSGNQDSCTFTGLSSSNRYIVTCEQLDGAKITVSEGRTISFWYSLGTVLKEIAGWIRG